MDWFYRLKGKIGELNRVTELKNQTLVFNLLRFHNSGPHISSHTVLTRFVVRAFVDQLKLFLRLVGRVLRFIHSKTLYHSDGFLRWTPASLVLGNEQIRPPQPFPTLPPPFARQTMTAKDLYTAFMTPEEKAHWEERFAKAQNKGLFTPTGLTDTISIPGVNGGPFFWNTGADAASGIVFVESKDFPSILKMVKAGESTASNSGGTIPSRIQAGGGRGRGGFGMSGGPPMPLRYGRTIYEGSCEICHGPDLKGDRGPAVDDAVKRLGAEAVRSIVKSGKGAMPAFPTMNAEAITDVIEFLDKSDQAPPGTGVPGNSLMERLEPDYPEGVTPPPSRYETGYGQEDNWYIVDSENGRIRKVTSSGIIATVAGSGICEYPGTPDGDGGAAIQAALCRPQTIAFDSRGNLFVLEPMRQRIRKVTPAGSISLAFTATELTALAIDSSDSFYITDSRIFMRIASDGTQTRISGGGTSATEVPGLNSYIVPGEGLILDGSGGMLFASDNQIFKLEPANIFPLLILDAASQRSDFLSAGKTVSIYWVDMGPNPSETGLPDIAGGYPPQLGGARILFNGIPAPILYVSQSQVTAIVPYALDGQPGVWLQAEYQGKLSNSISLPMKPATPGLFTVGGSKGQALAFNQDGGPNLPSHPSAQGSIVTFFATGAGALSPALLDGAVARDSASSPIHIVSFQIGGFNAEVIYAGVPAGSVAGILQINARVPQGVRAGNASVTLTIAGANSQPGVTLAVQ